MIYPVRNDFSRAGKYLFLFPNFPALETGVKTGYIMTHPSYPTAPPVEIFAKTL